MVLEKFVLSTDKNLSELCNFSVKRSTDYTD